VPLLDLARIRALLLDIEGTTTPLAFVHQTLFGYARENLRAFLEANASKPEVHNCVAELKAQHGTDDRDKRTPPAWRADSPESELASAVAYGLWLMDRDSKVGALKALQGLIWQQGYRSGRLKARSIPMSRELWIAGTGRARISPSTPRGASLRSGFFLAPRNRAI